MTKQATPEHRLGLQGQADTSASVSSPASNATDDAPAPSDAGSHFGAHLEPNLIAHCEGRLSAINWFRTDWQRGGALTGYATWTGHEGEPHPVVVKIPVPPRERRWLMRMQEPIDGHLIVPRVYAEGAAVGGYDLAWVVMERLPHGPLGRAWEDAAFDLTVEASACFYKCASAFPLGEPAADRDWAELLGKARKHIRGQDFPDAARWSAALKKAQKKLKKWLKTWEARPMDGWVHGDLHLGNAMSRHEPPHGPAVLFDLANVRVGSWVEDAVYFEHLYWAHRERLGGHRIAAEIARARRDRGLPVDANWPRVAEVYRVLLAMTTPVIMHTDGGGQHIAAALGVLEREVG